MASVHAKETSLYINKTSPQKPFRGITRQFLNDIMTIKYAYLVQIRINV